MRAVPRTIKCAQVSYNLAHGFDVKVHSNHDARSASSGGKVLIYLCGSQYFLMDHLRLTLCFAPVQVKVLIDHVQKLVKV
jgi:hypothetical protein